MPDWIPDGVNKVIKEPNIGSGDTNYDLARDIYSAWKRWVISGDGSKFDAAFIAEGGTPIGATGLFTGASLILINGWKLMGGDWDHQALIVGNLFSDDGVNTVLNPDHNANIYSVGSVGAQGIATGGALTSEQDARLTLAAALAEADQFFDQSEGLLHYYFKGTTIDIITPKTVTNAQVTQDTSIAQ